MTLYKSASRDAAVNLAAEEYLFSTVEEQQTILFLYENDPSVIIGRFQNPWRECRTGLARRFGVPVLRRSSGGGTVVHSPGNLNWSVITHAPAPRRDANLEMIIRAVNSLGVSLRRNKRSDLEIWRSELRGGTWCKVSGSAFRQKSGRSLHHGTLLVCADLTPLRRLLNTSARDMDARGVTSVKSTVANLCDAQPELTVDQVISVLTFGKEPLQVLKEQELFKQPEFCTALNRLRSEFWIWGKTPAFRERFRLPSDGTRIEFDVREGRVHAVSLPDSNGTHVIHSDLNALTGRSYQGNTFYDISPYLAARVDGDS